MNQELIIETYNKINQYNSELQNKFTNFINGCLDLENISDHKYEIQKTIKLNKIYFQGYVSESAICEGMRNENISKCSFDQIRTNIANYEQTNHADLYSYSKALDLYEEADDLEQTIDDKVKLEMTRLYELDKTIDEVVKVPKTDYEYLYMKVKTNLVNNYFQGDLNNKIFKALEFMLNDVFNYYISGYPDIPDEFI